MDNISLGRYNTGIYRHIQIIINHELNPYGLGSGQYIFLHHIFNNEGQSQKELTSNINIDKATTAKALKKLEEGDYIYRAQDEEDKRYNKIYLTEKGKDFMPVLKEKLGTVTKILVKGMSEEEIILSNSLLAVMYNNAVEAVALLKDTGK